jgi:hypothetical protein
MIAFVDPALLVSPRWRQVFTKSAGFDMTLNQNGVYDHQQSTQFTLYVADSDCIRVTIAIIPGTFGTTSYDPWSRKITVWITALWLATSSVGSRCQQKIKDMTCFYLLSGLEIDKLFQHFWKKFENCISKKINNFRVIK